MIEAGFGLVDLSAALEAIGTGIDIVDRINKARKLVCTVLYGDPAKAQAAELLEVMQGVREANEGMQAELRQLREGLLYGANLPGLQLGQGGDGGRPPLYLPPEAAAAAFGALARPGELTLVSAPLWLPREAMPLPGGTELALYRRYVEPDPDPDHIEVFQSAADGRVLVASQSRRALAAAGVAPLGRWRAAMPPREGGLSGAAAWQAAGLPPPAEPAPQAKQAPPPAAARPAAGSDAGSVLTLRAEPKTLDDAAVKRMLAERGFFDKGRNPEGGFRGELVDNGDQTLTDRATGLQWQRSGSDKDMTYDKVAAWVEQFNRQGLAGHRDWRLPTLEEAASLLRPDKNKQDRYIDPLFDPAQYWVWTADQRASGGAWLVGFAHGCVRWFPRGYGDRVRLCRGRGL